MRFKYIIPMDFISPEFSDQRWVYIHDICPEIYDYYMISDRGLVWNRRECRLMSTSAVSNGYLAVNLSGINGPKTTNIHRLVALAFVYNPDPQNRTFVNHKNGNKQCNEYWNLEWATQKENTHHAIDTGLMNPKRCSKLSIDQRDQIRSLLSENKYSCRQIAEMVGVSRSIVSHIRYGETWTDEGSAIQYKTRRVLAEKEICKICEYFVQHPNYYSPDYMREAAKYCNIENCDANLIKVLGNIYFRKTYTNISFNYDF